MTSLPNGLVPLAVAACFFTVAAAVAIFSRWGKYTVALGLIALAQATTMYQPSNTIPWETADHLATLGLGFVIVIIGAVLVMSRILARCAYGFVTSRSLVIVDDGSVKKADEMSKA
jgi:hypothetical protein